MPALKLLNLHVNTWGFLKIQNMFERMVIFIWTPFLDENLLPQSHAMIVNTMMRTANDIIHKLTKFSIIKLFSRMDTSNLKKNPPIFLVG